MGASFFMFRKVVKKMLNEVRYEVIDSIAVLGTNQTGNYTLELNRVSYNGSIPKLDLRRWDRSKGKMLKGITLTDNEAKALLEALLKEFS